jgi:Flp pilus assembly protein TadD
MRRRIWMLCALFAFALGVRMAYLYELRETPLFGVLIGDAHEYDVWAQSIAAGRWLGQDVFYHAPLYPCLLGLVFLVGGHHVFAMRLVQVVWGAASCVLLALAGERFFDRRTGLAAGCLLALCPAAVFFDGLIQKSSLDVLLVTALLWSMAVVFTRPRWPGAALAGVAAALLSFNRENARVVIPIVAAWLLLRRWPRGAAIFLAAVAAVLLPVALHNYATGGEFFVTTSQAGPNFYIGNHAGASGLYESLLPGRGNQKYEPEDARRLAESAAGRPLSPGDVSRYWIDRTLADIRQDPAGWLRLLGRKVLLSINASEVPDTESIAAYAEESSVLKALAWMDFGVLLPLAALGIWLERVRWRVLWPLWAIGAALVLSMAAFFVFARYRHPAIPIVALFAAVPVAQAAALWRGRTAAWAPALALAVAVAIVCRLPLDTGSDDTFLNLGRQLVADGRAAEAQPLLQRAVAQSPSDARGVYMLGVAFERAGDRTSALQQFRRAAELDPHDGHAQGSLALALVESGQAAAALEHFAASVRLAPADAALRANYGAALLETGNVAAAVPVLREASRLAPDNASTHASLGFALAQTGDDRQAIAELERAIALKPDFVDAQYALARLYVQNGRRTDAAALLQRALAAARASGRADAAAAIQSVLTQLGG